MGLEDRLVHLVPPVGQRLIRQQLAGGEVATHDGPHRPDHQRQPPLVGGAPAVGGPLRGLDEPVDAVQVAGGEQRLRPREARGPRQALVPVPLAPDPLHQADQLGAGGEGRGRSAGTAKDDPGEGMRAVGEDEGERPRVAQPAGQRQDHRDGGTDALGFACAVDQ